MNRGSPSERGAIVRGVSCSTASVGAGEHAHLAFHTINLYLARATKWAEGCTCADHLCGHPIGSLCGRMGLCDSNSLSSSGGATRARFSRMLPKSSSWREFRDG